MAYTDKEFEVVPQMEGLNAELIEEACALPPSDTLPFDTRRGARAFANPGLPNACRPSLIIMALVPASLCILVWGAMTISKWDNFPRRHGPPRPGTLLPTHTATPARNLMESPKLVNVVLEQVHAIKPDSGMSKETLHRGVSQALSEFGSLLDQNLSPKQKVALRDAHIDKETWLDLGKVLRAIRNGTVVKLGRHVFETIANSSSTEEDIQALLTKDLQSQGDKLAHLREELVPSRFLNNGGDVAGHTVDIWQTILSPEALKDMRRTDALDQVQLGSVVRDQLGRGSISEHVRYLKQRVRNIQGGGSKRAADFTSSPMLRQLTASAETLADSPTLDGLELSFSIAGLTLVVVLEVLVHMSFMVEGFDLPKWGWLMVVSPTDGMAVATCFYGLSIWCDLILGAIGLNIIELPLLGLADVSDGKVMNFGRVPVNPYETEHRIR